MYKHVVPYVNNWEDLGIQLGLQSHELDCISRDNQYSPTRTSNCCKAVFKKWLEKECSPTWDKLEDAVNAIDNNIASKCLDSNSVLN